MSQDPSTTNPKAPEDWRVGLFFLTHYPSSDRDGWAGKPESQGRVVRHLNGEAYEVQFYSWFDGEPSKRVVKLLPYFEGASWYATEEEWVRAGSKGIGNNEEEAVEFWRKMKELDARPASHPKAPRTSGKLGVKTGPDPRAMSTKLRFHIFERDNFTCRYCGRTPPAVRLQIDHVIPIVKGGKDEEANLVTSCFECNNGKRDKVLHVVKPEEEPTP